jgi:hypothetical protein
MGEIYRFNDDRPGLNADGTSQDVTADKALIRAVDPYNPKTDGRAGQL